MFDWQNKYQVLELTRCIIFKVCDSLSGMQKSLLHYTGASECMYVCLSPLIAGTAGPN